MFCKDTQDRVIEKFVHFSGHLDRAIDNECLIDYFGIYIPINLAKYLQGRGGGKIVNPPYPDDSIRAGYIEYLAVVDSILDAQKYYQMSEIGASYAPFSAVAGYLALKHGIEKIALRPVEASFEAKKIINENLNANNLLNDHIDVKIIQAAVVGEFKSCYFPANDPTIDNGGAAQDDWSELDYRGAAVPLRKVKGIPLSFVIDSFAFPSPIDLLHVDIQGSEIDALPKEIDKLNAKVKRILVGTHSRLIEGRLLELFHAAGWELLAEQSCEFVYRNELSSFVGMTIVDGNQYWMNPLLAEYV